MKTRIRMMAIAFLVFGGLSGGTALAADDAIAAILQTRQSGMEDLNLAMKGLGEQIMSKAPDPVEVAKLAAHIADIGGQVDGWFPPSTMPRPGEPTAASPALWHDRAGFSAKVADLKLAAADLAAYASTGKVTLLMPKAQAIDSACVACHRSFRTSE